MKIISKFAVAALAFAAIEGVCAAQDDHKIGVIVSSTGPVATVMLRQLKTYEWWADKVNANGGINGRQVRLIYCNDGSSPERAVTCAREIIAQDVALIINNTLTGPTRAVMPLVEHGPVMLTPSPNIMPPPTSLVFQTSPSNPNMIQALADFLKKNDIKEMGMIAATDASGEVAFASAQEVFSAEKLSLQALRIDINAMDATSQLARLAANDVGVIFSAYSGGGAAAVVKNFSMLGLKQPLIVTYANVSDPFVSLIQNHMPQRLMGVGLKALDPELLADPKARQRVLAFAKDFEAYSGNRVDMLNLLALVTTDTVEAILENVEDTSDPESVRDFLENNPIESFQTLRFSPQNHVGMTASDLAVLEYRDGSWKAANPIQ